MCNLSDIINYWFRIRSFNQTLLTYRLEFIDQYFSYVQCCWFGTHELNSDVVGHDFILAFDGIDTSTFTRAMELTTHGIYGNWFSFEVTTQRLWSCPNFYVPKKVSIVKTIRPSNSIDDGNCFYQHCISKFSLNPWIVFSSPFFIRLENCFIFSIDSKYWSRIIW